MTAKKRRARKPPRHETHVIFVGVQIKSVEAFCRFAAAVNEIEEQTGIHETAISLKDIFFCPWIDVERCRGTPMERLLIGMIERM